MDRRGSLGEMVGPAGVACIGAEIDLRVGGRYRIGNRLPDGSELWIEGEFERVEPIELLVYSWQIPPAGKSERVSTRFVTLSRNSTEVIITHERIPDLLQKIAMQLAGLGALRVLQRMLASDRGGVLAMLDGADTATPS